MDDTEELWEMGIVWVYLQFIIYRYVLKTRSEAATRDYFVRKFTYAPRGTCREVEFYNKILACNFFFSLPIWLYH